MFFTYGIADGFFKSSLTIFTDAFPANIGGYSKKKSLQGSDEKNKTTHDISSEISNMTQPKVHEIKVYTPEV